MRQGRVKVSSQACRLAAKVAVAAAGLTLVVPLVAAALVAAPAGAAVLSSRTSASALVEVGALAKAPSGAKALGPLPASQRIAFGVALQPRDPTGLTEYATAVSTPGSAEYHRFLTPAEFAARYAPSRSRVAAVEDLLRRSGLTSGAPSANGLLVPVTGTAARIEAAFHTRLTGYRLAGDRLGWSADSAMLLPASVASSVSTVVGLDNLLSPRSPVERAPASPAPSAATTSAGKLSSSQLAVAAGSPRACVAAADAALGAGGWTDQELASAYGLEGLYRQGDLGAGQTIAVFELEPFAPSDLTTFDQCYFGTSHAARVSTVKVDGFDLSGTGTGEALLDLEDLQALAPAAHIVVYEAPNTTFGALDAYNEIVSQDRANIVSTSWGECEPALQTATPEVQQLENTLFEEAAAQGQTVFAAAGDTGSDDCASTPYSSTTPAPPYLSVDDPASQPFVVGVGGTSMTNDVDPPAQTVWNDGAKWGGGGGGYSNTWASPAWQEDSGVPGLDPTGAREVPDVSAAADEWRGITVFSSLFGTGPGSDRSSDGSARGASSGGSPSPPSGWTTLGGTSSAAPIWAATAADIAASAECRQLPRTAAGPSLGFIAPLLYEVASSPTTYASSFDNVKVGSNDVFGLGLGYRAHAGYNLAAGLGTPVVTDAAGRGGLDASLCALAVAASNPGPAPTVTTIAPGSGTTAGGTSVTITGSGFPAGDPSAVDVRFGVAAATVTAVPSATSLVATVPAAELARGAATLAGSGNAGVVEVTVTVHSGSLVRTSRPGVGAQYHYVAVSTSGAALPSVLSLGPSGGNLAGGNVVTIYGSGFSDASSSSGASAPLVSFGAVAASSVQVLSDDELRATVPPEGSATDCARGSGFDPTDACQVEVTVSDAAGTSPTSPILPALSGPVVFQPDGVVAPTVGTEVTPAPTEYDYAPKPVITAIRPNPGDASGESPVEILGSGFNFDTLEWVNFGPAGSVASEQTQILEITSNVIEIAPPPAAGNGSGNQRLTGGVSVQTVGGLSHAVPFSYGGIPTVNAISKLGGPSTGGTRLVIEGAGMQAVDYVRFRSEVQPQAFGSSATITVSARTAAKITVTTPADLPGPVDVIACSATGCSRPDPAVDTFVYYAVGPPSLSRLSSTSGPAAGGSELTLFGEGLDGALAVRFGSASSSRFENDPVYPDGDPYILTVTTPPGSSGATVPVRVVTHSGTSPVTSVTRYRYLPSPPSAPEGLRVSLSGPSARLSWSAPASTGGAAVTGYRAEMLSSTGAPVVAELGARSDAATFAGLQAGSDYLFEVAARSGKGLGPVSTLGPVVGRDLADGYRLVNASGVVQGFGSLSSLGGLGGMSLSAPVVAIAGAPGRTGYWLVQQDGTVRAFGGAPQLGFVHPAHPVIGLAPLPDGHGYWLADRSGQVYAIGAARNYGSLPAGRLPKGTAIVAVVASPSGQGYWLVSSSGTLYAFGHTPQLHAALRLVAGASIVAAASSGDGLLVAASNGAVFPLGTAARGGRPPVHLNGRVVGIATGGDGDGYWLVTSTGAVYSFDGVRYEGRAALAPGAASRPGSQIVGIAAL